MTQPVSGPIEWQAKRCDTPACDRVQWHEGPHLVRCGLAYRGEQCSREQGHPGPHSWVYQPPEDLRSGDIVIATGGERRPWGPPGA